MDSLEHAEQETAEEDDEVEFTGLDPLGDAGSQKSSWLASIVLDWQRSPHRLRYRRRWRLTSTLSLLLLLVILFALNRGPSSFIVNGFTTALFQASGASSSFATMPTLPRRDGIACLADAAWSPDSHFIAVLGYQGCPQDSYVPGLVDLYDAHSSQLLRQLHPDDAIVRGLSASLSPLVRQAVQKILPDSPVGGGLPVIDYEHVTWSPDGQRLAFTFGIAAQQPSVHGVVLMDKDGGSVQVLLQQQPASGPLHTEWDLSRALSIVFSTSTSALALQPFPPALAYHWGANGTLVPEMPLSTLSLPAVPSSQPGSIGNPDGDASFTIWQPGSAHVISLEDTSRVSTMYTWNTDFAAWSPDGRYLIDGIGLTGLLQPPGQLFPSHKALVALGLNQAPLLPIHDGALLMVVERATALAWSPDGRILAAYTAGNIINLYDCVNGHKLASLLVQTKYPAPAAQAIIMRWSSDGSHLLLSSVAWGLMSIWSPNHLS